MPYDVNATGVGNSLIAPPATVLPGETPEEFHARMARWTPPGGIDPRTQALLQFGSALMQPVPLGQSSAGHVGRAITGGVDTFQQAQAKRAQAAQGNERASREGRLAEGTLRTQAENEAASRQNRGIQAQKAPQEIETAALNLRTAQKAFDLIVQEERAGNRSPDFLRRKATAEVALREAQARELDARSRYLGSQAQATAKQTINVQKVENGDGTTSIVTHMIIGGQPYQEVMTLPRFTTPKDAQAQAEKEVDEETPGLIRGAFGARPGYTGTREQEIARRTQEYMQPKREYWGPQGRMTPQQYQQVSSTPATPVTPQPVSSDPNAPMPPAFPGQESRQDSQNLTAGRIRTLQHELANTNDPEEKARLRKEIASVKKDGASAATQRPERASTSGAASGATPPQEFVRDQNGQLVPKGKAPVTPSATAQGNQVAASQQRLATAKKLYVEANRAMLPWSFQKQKSNPEEYRAALQLLAQRKQELEQAQQDAATQAQTASQLVQRPPARRVWGEQ